jgi:predicted nucleotidyltransferase
MENRIQQQLTQLEEERGIRILFACESGSRAWGFHSPDSDYDVRFIYAHNRDWYTSIEEKKDLISFPPDEVLDIVGYDIRKALRLFRASNAKIYEWIQSPIVYKQDAAFVASLQDCIAAYYSTRAGMHHYLGLTRNTMDVYLQGDEVNIKKYFYALRPVLAALWIKTYAACPPMQFSQLRLLIKDVQVNNQIDQLLALKATAAEGALIPRDPVLHTFIQQTWDACMEYGKQLGKRETTATALDQLFRKTIGW